MLKLRLLQEEEEKKIKEIESVIEGYINEDNERKAIIDELFKKNLLKLLRQWRKKSLLFNLSHWIQISPERGFKEA